MNNISSAISLLALCILTAISRDASAAPKDQAPAKATQAQNTVKLQAASLTPEQKTDSKTSSTPNLDLSKAPTNISANSLTLLNDKRTFTYEGNVVVTQADMTLNSDFLDGSYSEKNEIEKIIARSNVIITKGPDMKANGQRAVYDAIARTIVLTESPSVEQNGSILTADLIRIFVDENRSVAEGNVKVTLKSTDTDVKIP
jgi:lipopolysaccharide transport protein LptA